MKNILSVLVSCYLVCVLGGRLEAQISLSEIQDTIAKGYVPITDYDPLLGVYIQKYMLLQDYLEDSISWVTVPTQGGGMDSTYNGNRAISRVPQVGDNTGATTFREWLDWWYVDPYEQPNIVMNSFSPSTTIYEVGTSNSITVSGSTTNNCSFTLSNGDLTAEGVSVHTFGANTTYSYVYTYAPTTNYVNWTMTASQDWDETGSTCEDGTPDTGTDSASRNLQARYPIYMGMSATDYSVTTIPYNPFGTGCDNKRLLLNQDIPYTSTGTCSSTNTQAFALTGTSEYIYIMIPQTWVDHDALTIYDNNGFNITGSFTRTTESITSTGLTNNWTTNYSVWKLNSVTTLSGEKYGFTQ